VGREMEQRFAWSTAAFLALGTVCLPAQAATIFFGENQSPGFAVSGDPLTAHNNFLSSLIGVGTQSFESQSIGQTAPIVLSFPGSSGSISATLTGSNVVVENNNGDAGQGGNLFGRFATSGSQYLDTSTSNFTVTFSQPVAAFGFYATDVGDIGGQLTVTTVNGGSHVYTVANTLNGNDGSLLFWGIIDTANPFLSVSFGNSAAGDDFFGFDDLTIGDLQQVNPNPTPLPAALPLFASGIGVFGYLGWRRKRKAPAAS